MKSELQLKIESVVENMSKTSPVLVYNLPKGTVKGIFGTKRFRQKAQDEEDAMRKTRKRVKPLYKIEGRLYYSLPEAAEAYNLEHKYTVVNRVRATAVRWVDWVYAKDQD